MELKKLYNINTDTLIILDPKKMLLEVRKGFAQVYPIERNKFIALYSLCLSHPYMLSYTEIMNIMGGTSANIAKTSDLKKLIKSLKLDLSSYGVERLIIDIKNTGYAISNKWVEPSQIGGVSKDKTLVDYIIPIPS